MSMGCWRRTRKGSDADASGALPASCWPMDLATTPGGKRPESESWRELVFLQHLFRMLSAASNRNPDLTVA